jgi:hypothetical protein
MQITQFWLCQFFFFFFFFLFLFKKPSAALAGVFNLVAGGNRHAFICGHQYQRINMPPKRLANLTLQNTKGFNAFATPPPSPFVVARVTVSLTRGFQNCHIERELPMARLGFQLNFLVNDGGDVAQVGIWCVPYRVCLQQGVHGHH